VTTALFHYLLLSHRPHLTLQPPHHTRCSQVDQLGLSNTIKTIATLKHMFMSPNLVWFIMAFSMHNFAYGPGLSRRRFFFVEECYWSQQPPFFAGVEARHVRDPIACPPWGVPSL
jgi:hypothetical protein